MSWVMNGEQATRWFTTTNNQTFPTFISEVETSVAGPNGVSTKFPPSVGRLEWLKVGKTYSRRRIIGIFCSWFDSFRKGFVFRGICIESYTSFSLSEKLYLVGLCSIKAAHQLFNLHVRQWHPNFIASKHWKGKRRVKSPPLVPLQNFFLG